MGSLFLLVFINKLIFFETPKIMPNGTGAWCRNKCYLK